MNKTKEEKRTETKPKTITVLQQREDQLQLIRDSLEDAYYRLEELQSDVDGQVEELEKLDIENDMGHKGIMKEEAAEKLFGLGRLPDECEVEEAIAEVEAVSEKLEGSRSQCSNAVDDIEEVEFEWSWGPKAS